MSVDIFVIIKKEKMVTPAQWQQAITDHGFDLQIDTDFDVEEHTGFLPCKYKGQDSGFEYFFEEMEVDWLDEADMKNVGDRNYLVNFTTHSDLTELIAATVASSVLCSIIDGLILDESEGSPFISAINAIEYAKKAELNLLADEASVDTNAGSDSDEETEHEKRKVKLEISIAGPGGKMANSPVGMMEIHELRTRQMSLMELWSNGTLTAKQQKELNAIDAELFKLKNK